MYATEADVTRWLSSITDLKDQPLPPFAADRDETSEPRQRKRQKLDRHRHKIPSPPTSEPVPKAAMSSSSRKRTRTDDHDPYDASSSAHSNGPNNEITPRPGRFQQLEWVPFSADRGTNSPSRSSASNQSPSASNQSRHGTVSNKSSPSKQFRNAEMKETGFYVGSFSRQSHPESLRALRIELRDIGLGNGILPASLESELRSLGSEIPRFAFDKDEATRANTEEIASNLPLFSWVKRLVDRAVECQNDREGEASWNADVHAPVLEQIFRSDRFESQGMVDFRCCPSAQILPAYKSRDAPSTWSTSACLYVLSVEAPRNKPSRPSATRDRDNRSITPTSATSASIPSRCRSRLSDLASKVITRRCRWERGIPRNGAVCVAVGLLSFSLVLSYRAMCGSLSLVF